MTDALARCNTPSDHAKSRRLRMELDILQNNVIAEIERRLTRTRA